MAEKISSFRDLKVYKRAFTLQQTIFEVSKGFPREELYSLTDQIRRASRSIGSNVAEAWHKRKYKAHFLSKLTDSDAEQAETQHWLDTSLTCEYISAELHKDLLDDCQEIGRMLGGMMARADTFCKQATKKR